MPTGSLMFPVGYLPLDDNGNPVPSGKLAFTRSGTSTSQNTYSDSALTTPNANPVILNSAGRLTTKIYGDPSTGFDYRVRLLTSADAEVWSFDDVVVDGADTATFASGSFTGTLTGMSGATTGTVTYKVFANADGTGKLCTLHTAAQISGTSNTTAFTMTGLPAACAPTVAVRVACDAIDNDVSVATLAIIAAAATTITFATDAPFSTTGWTNTGGKGLYAGWSVTYPL